MPDMYKDVGNTYLGAVYRDGWFLVLSESTNTIPLAAAGFVTTAAVDAALLISRAYRAGHGATAANGWVELGAGDGLEFIFLGTDTANENCLYLVTTIHPVFDPEAADPSVPACYIESIAAAGNAQLGSAVAGDAGGALAGVTATDLIADTITETTSLAGAEAYSPADNTIGHLTVAGEGAVAMRVQVDIDSGGAASDSAVNLARRIAGSSQRD